MGNARANELLKELSKLQWDTEAVRREAAAANRTNVELYAKGANGAYADALARVSVALPTIIAEAVEALTEHDTWLPGELLEVYGK